MLNIFKEGELVEDEVEKNRKFRFFYQAYKYYNLDAIISVGYRVKSHQGTKFRLLYVRKGGKFLMFVNRFFSQY
ncbi:RhuM family protein [Sphingobacterium chuzhouense]|uniref:RhuM family protein n=1 Tax=Sphingobacterium chuzhouense TaxID=1742264 RepID=UPI00293C0E6A|nr:RhuM family protein [Sphingobacterium chuzhouense]